jgi:hypothetical protein
MNKSLSLIIFSLFLTMGTIGCKKVDPCSGRVCYNGGSAVPNGNTCFCRCLVGYSETYCENFEKKCK